MHAFLLIGQDEQLLSKKIAEITTNIKSTKMEFEVQKIADVRELKDFLKINLPQKTTIVVKHFNKVSIEAQNALLKEIEEPQEKLSYILVSNSFENILPTIMSRCEVSELQENPTQTQNERKDAETFLSENRGVQLKKVTTIKDREEALQFLTTLYTYCHEKLLTNSDYAKKLENISTTMKALKANGNIQLHLTKFIIDL